MELGQAEAHSISNQECYQEEDKVEGDEYETEIKNKEIPRNDSLLTVSEEETNATDVQNEAPQNITSKISEIPLPSTLVSRQNFKVDVKFTDSSGTFINHFTCDSKKLLCIDDKFKVVIEISSSKLPPIVNKIPYDDSKNPFADETDEEDITQLPKQPAATLTKSTLQLQQEYDDSKNPFANEDDGDDCLHISNVEKQWDLQHLKLGDTCISNIAEKTNIPEVLVSTTDVNQSGMFDFEKLSDLSKISYEEETSEFKIDDTCDRDTSDVLSTENVEESTVTATDAQNVDQLFNLPMELENNSSMKSF